MTRQEMARQRAVQRAQSKIRVARACLIGLDEALKDARAFTARSIQALEEAGALVAAGELPVGRRARNAKRPGRKGRGA